MTHTWLLGKRALVEGLRTPEALFPTLFIPLFFLAVNVGQAARALADAADDAALPRQVRNHRKRCNQSARDEGAHQDSTVIERHGATPRRRSIGPLGAASFNLIIPHSARTAPVKLSRRRPPRASAG